MKIEPGTMRRSPSAGPWGNAVIATGNGPVEDRERILCHRGIRVEGNRFRIFDSRIVNLYGMDGFHFAADIGIGRTDDCPGTFDESLRFVTTCCADVTIDR